MIAAIALSSVLGSWVCSVKDDPHSTVAYTLKASGQGKYVKSYRGYPPRVYRPVVDFFTFQFSGGQNDAWLIESIAQRGGGVLKEKHVVHFVGKHMIDIETGFWRDDGEYASSPDKEYLDCTKRG